MRPIISLFIAASLSTASFAVELSEEHVRALREQLAANAVHGPVVPQPQSILIQPAAAKTIDLTATAFFYDPDTITVNAGDVVTLRVSVPASDGGEGPHGILMDTYIETPQQVSKGQTRSITFTATTAGTFPFVCPNSGCGIGHSNMFGRLIVNAVVVQPPHVTSLSPTSGSTAGGTAVTITGTDFTSGATVTFGGTPATNVQVTSSTSITATTPAHAAGAVSVVVTNPDGQSGTLANGFTYAVPNPTVTAISPNTGPTSGNTFVTVTGTNFQSGATVTVGGAAATNVTVVNATTITAMTPLGPANEQLGAKDVVVTNPNAAKGTLTGGFTYSRPPLAVSLITPSAALVAGGQKIAISGAGFTTALPTTITIGGAAATNIQVVDAVTVTATAPAHAAGPVDVVVNVGGTAVTAKGMFGYVASSPRHHAAKH